ncbi:MAG: hypothetical protein MMC23_004631 [Stictis urceolatum]|nr:hypothetical protein [Stictis urceolata]
MASTGANVLRWSALFSGISYGLYHQSQLKSQAQLNDVQRKWKDEESLIARAKAEWVKKTLPKDKQTAGGDVISDPNDPKFDLEAYLTMQEAKQT